jgi:hypothetical protein
MNVEIGTEATQFLFWEYLNGIYVSVGSINYPRNMTHEKVMTLSESVISVMMIGFYTFSAAAAEQPLLQPWQAKWSFKASGTDLPSLYKSHLPPHSPTAKLAGRHVGPVLYGLISLWPVPSQNRQKYLPVIFSISHLSG